MTICLLVEYVDWLNQNNLTLNFFLLILSLSLSVEQSFPISAMMVPQTPQPKEDNPFTFPQTESHEPLSQLEPPHLETEDTQPQTESNEPLSQLEPPHLERQDTQPPPLNTPPPPLDVLSMTESQAPLNFIEGQEDQDMDEQTSPLSTYEENMELSQAPNDDPHSFNFRTQKPVKPGTPKEALQGAFIHACLRPIKDLVQKQMEAEMVPSLTFYVL